MNENELIYTIALTMIPHVGSITARKLIAYTGSAAAVFRENPGILKKIPGVGDFIAKQKNTPGLIGQAEKELLFMKKNKIRWLTVFDNDYPERLKQCPDAPLVIYFRGENIFNYSRILSVVGTRRATSYGIEYCQKIIRELSEGELNPVIISGLAYGIDYQAHLAALNAGLKTVAVLAHGLHTIYPFDHRRLAEKIADTGALVTDFTSGENPERNNFLKRNRIIAGLSDATIVIESGLSGGALITADFACSYNRDVFALPGKASDVMSSGCNKLIKNNKAALIESSGDLLYMLGWKKDNEKILPRQRHLFTELNDEEKKLVEILKSEEALSVDILSIRMDMPVSKISSLLLNLEFQGVVKVLPGNMYKLL